MDTVMSINHGQADQTASPPLPRPRVVLIGFALAAAALVDLVLGLSDATALFDGAAGIPDAGLRGILIRTHLVSHPALALAALALASAGKLRHAIMAMAAVMVISWLREMPSIVHHGFELRGVGSIETMAKIVVFPLMAACAWAFAARNERLGLATCYVIFPTLFAIFSVVAFAIGVSIYGF